MYPEKKVGLDGHLVAVFRLTPELSRKIHVCTNSKVMVRGIKEVRELMYISMI